MSAFGSGYDPRIWDQVPHWAPCMEPASPSAYVSAALSHEKINKSFLKNKDFIYWRMSEHKGCVCPINGYNPNLDLVLLSR